MAGQSRRGKYVVKAVPVTANNVTASIMNLLTSEGHLPARINTEGQFVPLDTTWHKWDTVKAVVEWLRSLHLVIGWFRKSNSTIGVSDILCCLAPRGTLLAIEVKIGSDRLRPEQSQWLKDVIARGGMAYVVHSYTEFVQIYFNEIKPIIKSWQQ